MEYFKKILPYILLAIVFAVGGYFIGKGAGFNQGASLYTTIATNARYAVETTSTDEIETMKKKKCIAQGGQYLGAGHCFFPAPIKEVPGKIVVANLTMTLAECKDKKGLPLWRDSAQTEYIGCIVTVVERPDITGTPVAPTVPVTGTKATTTNKSQ